MTLFTKVMLINLTNIIFETVPRLNVDLCSFWLKMIQFLPFSPKLKYFDQINSINNTFDQSYVNKPKLK